MTKPQAMPIPRLADLDERRFVKVAEVREGARLDPSLLANVMRRDEGKAA